MDDFLDQMALAGIGRMTRSTSMGITTANIFDISGYRVAKNVNALTVCDIVVARGASGASLTWLGFARLTLVRGRGFARTRRQT